MPISFHTVGLPYRKPDAGTPDYCQYVAMGINFTLFQLSGAEYLASIILPGACSKNPDFNFVLGECGVGWIPYVLHRLDQEYKDRLFHLNLEMDPSDYWRRQGHSTFQDEVVTQELVDLIGVSNILWGSDYPHPDGILARVQTAPRKESGRSGPRDTSKHNVPECRRTLPVQLSSGRSRWMMFPSHGWSPTHRGYVSSMALCMRDHARPYERTLL